MRRTLLALLLLSQCTPALVRADDEPKQEGSDKKLWLVDFEKAKKIAAEKGLDVMMEFTGSDWCPPCKALKAGVFDKEVFQTTAPKHFVLVKIDSMRDKSKQTKEEIEQYRKLSKEYGIRGVPTVLLADPTGKPYAKFVGYGGDKADAYTEKLVAEIANRKTRDEAFAKAEKAQGVERAKLLAEGVGAVSDELAVTEYKNVIEEIIKLDANDEAGLKTKFENELKIPEIKKALQTIQRENRKDTEAALKAVDEMVSTEKLTGKLLQEALFVKGAMQFREDKDAAKSTLQEAIKAAPQSSKAKEIKGILERFFKGDDQ